MYENGNLIFAKLMSSDEGRYQCSAQNVVATRETAAVLLSVHGRFKLRLCFCSTATTTRDDTHQRFDMIHPDILSIPLLIFYLSTYVEEPSNSCVSYMSATHCGSRGIKGGVGWVTFSVPGGEKKM